MGYRVRISPAERSSGTPLSLECEDAGHWNPTLGHLDPGSDLACPAGPGGRPPVLGDFCCLFGFALALSARICPPSATAGPPLSFCTHASLSPLSVLPPHNDT